MDKNDYDKNCKYYLCKKCYHPCYPCGGGMCEQCRYGYMNIVSKFKVKYSKEELDIIKEQCQYAEWALDLIKQTETVKRK